MQLAGSVVSQGAYAARLMEKGCTMGVANRRARKLWKRKRWAMEPDRSSKAPPGVTS